MEVAQQPGVGGKAFGRGNLARRCGGIAVFISGLLGMASAVHAQAPQNISSHLQVRTANERSTLDRTTGEIISSVDVTLINLGGREIRTPLHAVLNLSTTVTSVAGAQGGPADPLYGRYYRDLSGELPQQRLAANDAVSFHLDFRYPRGRALTYEIEPHGSVAPAAPPVLSLEPLEYELQTGERLAIPMTATDEDSPVVTIGCEPAHPQAMFASTSGLPAAAIFTFAPSNGTQGVFVFVFKARDSGGLTDEKHVQVTVYPANRAPTVSAPETISVDEGAQVAIPVTAADPDGDPVSLSVGPLPDNAIFVQTAGGITFAPDYGQQGVYSVTCTASDGQASSAPKTVEITVNDVQTGPDADKLELVVHPVESPTLVARQRVTGTVNADTNLPPPVAIESALITGLAPATARQGQTLDVALAGKDSGKFTTHFDAATSMADFGPGITVNRLTVTGPFAATANVTLAADAALGARGVQVRTLGETAVAVPAFHVLEGRASISGVLTDPETGLPIAGAIVSIAGTTLAALTGPDGAFTLNDVPTGPQTLIVNPPDHEVLRIEVDAGFGTPLVLSNLTARSIVFDPDAPASVSVLSVLGRGFGDLRAGTPLDQARATVRDAFLLAGGNEVGVLDEFGSQLNGAAAGDGLMSVRDKGIELLATRLAQGDTTTLLEVLLDLSGALEWSGGTPPAYLEWIAELQAAVNAAWADPGDPENAVPLLTFSQGARLTPDPPVLDGATRITKAQAFLLLSGFMTAAYNHRLDWLTGADAGGAGTRVKFPRGTRRDPPGNGRYTATWADLAVRMGKTPADFTFGAVSGFTNGTPGMEKLYRDYFLDGSTNSLAALREGLLQTFPDVGFVETIFDRDPYAVAEVLTNLTGLIDTNDAMRFRFNNISGHPAGGEDFNLWSAMDLIRGPAVYYPLSLLPIQNQLWPQIVTYSMVPGAPRIHLARETRVKMGPAGAEIDIPGGEILFFPSPDDNLSGGRTTFVYRLWIEDKALGATSSVLRLLRAGQVYNASSGTAGYDQPEKANSNVNGRALLRWKDPLPPAGIVHYRIDCIRGEESILDTVRTNAKALAFIRPWFEGYLDMGDPRSLALENLNAFGRDAIHPGTTYLNGSKIQFSALSGPFSVNISGAGSGLSNVGRVDLAARYDALDNAYASFPDFMPEGRGTGVILLYTQGQLGSEIMRPGFMLPGQAGLEIDDEKMIYSVNGASEAIYGGKVFRWDTDPKTGLLSNRLHIATVNYYSMLLQRPNPVSVQALRMGAQTTNSAGPELFVADALDNRIKTLDVQAAADAMAGFPDAPWHVNGKTWAEDTTNAATPVLAFGPYTDMAFDRAKQRLFVTQGDGVVEVRQGKDKAWPVFTNGTLVSTAAGCDVCEKKGKEFLYVADRVQGRILRIPLADIPITVPSDPVAKGALLRKYTALEGLDMPQALRIFENGRAMIYVDERGFHYERFGFSGRAEDSRGQPLEGASVTLQTKDSLQSSVADRDGVYFFRLETLDPRGTVTVNHPRRSYTESILVDYRCGGEVRPEPLVLVTNVLGEAITASRNFLVTTAATVRVAGEIQPIPIAFYQTGGLLEVADSAGPRSLPLHFAATNNEFTVGNVPLALGDNSMVVRVHAAGIYEPGASERFVIRREAP